MTKQTGLGDRLYVGGFDLSGDVGSLGAIGGGPEAKEVTGIDKSAFERIGGKRDGRIEFNSWFNPASNQQHDVLAALPRTDVGLLYTRGNVQGAAAAGMVAKQINYDPTRNDDGSLEWSIEALANGFGLEWGRLITDGLETETVAGATAGLDAGVDVGTTNFGAQLYVQVTAFTGTGVLIGLETSSDDGAGDAYAGVAGTASFVAGVGTLRLPSTSATAAIERYTRVSFSGTFTSVTYVAMLVRNLTARAF